MNKVFLLATILFLSVSSFAQFLNNITIEGKITNAGSQWITLSKLGGGEMIALDSSKISSNNSFYISTNIDGANYYQLSNGGKQYTILILEPGENIVINIDAMKMLQPSLLEGSQNSLQLYSIIKKVNAFSTGQQQLEKQYTALNGTPEQSTKGQEIISQYTQLENQKIDYLRNEINKKPSLAILLFMDQLPIDDNLDSYEKLDKALYSKYKDNAFVQDLHGKVDSKLMLAIGKTAPEINLASPDGPYIKLSSLRGKVVLIDFWASWCSPCRRDNPHNVKIYNKYKSKGFEIYGVSLDKTKSAWVKAIKDDGLTWTHVSDLRYWQSVAAKAYGVGSIPFTVLIDAEGKVIAKGLRGDALEQKLEEIFGK